MILRSQNRRIPGGTENISKYKHFHISYNNILFLLYHSRLANIYIFTNLRILHFKFKIFFCTFCLFVVTVNVLERPGNKLVPVIAYSYNTGESCHEC